MLSPRYKNAAIEIEESLSRNSLEGRGLDDLIEKTVGEIPALHQYKYVSTYFYSTFTRTFTYYNQLGTYDLWTKWRSLFGNDI